MHAHVNQPPPGCPDGLHVINGWTICCDGLSSHYWFSHRVPDDQIEIAKSFLTRCGRTRWARELISPLSCDLKHWIGCWARQYICNGAVLIAALQLGIVIVPCGERSALIGVAFDSAAEVMAERGWSIAPDAVTPSRIKPPKPPPNPTEEQWRVVHIEVAKQIGVNLDAFYELVSKLQQDNMENGDVRF